MIIIIDTFRIYTCLRDDGNFEAETVWGTEKTMDSVSRVDIICALRELLEWVIDMYTTEYS